MTTTIEVTKAERNTLRRIEAVGYVYRDHSDDGVRYRLPSGRIIDRKRIARLIAIGALVGRSDGLFGGGGDQSFEVRGGVEWFVSRDGGRLRHLVFKAFRQHGHMTDEAVETLAVFAEFGPSSVRKRRTELVKDGFLTSMGFAVNSRGRRMTVWGIAPKYAHDAPGHTDLMVSPEAIDAALAANPPPVDGPLG